MKKTADIAIAILFAGFALGAFITAIAFSAWWHYITGCMFAILAYVCYKAD
ncbi:MAG: hypothetical protein J5733_05820 [Bacteroidaceae bacterium]|nr:hypothetical protein [Bacteroidaceae bacterium]